MTPEEIEFQVQSLYLHYIRSAVVKRDAILAKAKEKLGREKNKGEEKDENNASEIDRRTHAIDKDKDIPKDEYQKTQN